jgi:hypothetical protein
MQSGSGSTTLGASFSNPHSFPCCPFYHTLGAATRCAGQATTTSSPTEAAAAEQPPPPPLPTEQELDDCLKTLYKIFVIGNDPSMMFLAHLGPVILLLLELHSAIVLAGVSHLVGPVKQLVQRYLKHADRATAVGTLRAFAFNRIPAEARLGRMRKMNQVKIYGISSHNNINLPGLLFAV